MKVGQTNILHVSGSVKTREWSCYHRTNTFLNINSLQAIVISQNLKKNTLSNSERQLLVNWLRLLRLRLWHCIQRTRVDGRDLLGWGYDVIFRSLKRSCACTTSHGWHNFRFHWSDSHRKLIACDGSGDQVTRCHDSYPRSSQRIMSCQCLHKSLTYIQPTRNGVIGTFFVAKGLPCNAIPMQYLTHHVFTMPQHEQMYPL